MKEGDAKVSPSFGKVLHAGSSGQKALAFEQLIYLGGLNDHLYWVGELPGKPVLITLMAVKRSEGRLPLKENR